MRITGGTARGRKLTTPKSEPIRPTCDRVREALFNILGQRVVDSRVLDLFAGTGAFGVEALSRGAREAVFVDQSRAAGRLIEANLRACIARPRAVFVALTLGPGLASAQLVAALPPNGPFDLIFLDPPYLKNLAQPVLTMVEQARLLAADGCLIVEENRRAELPEQVAGLILSDQRRYGETGLWFYHPATESPVSP